jgi:hypothetical protein
LISMPFLLEDFRFLATFNGLETSVYEVLATLRDAWNHRQISVNRVSLYILACLHDWIDFIVLPVAVSCSRS